MRCNDRDSGEGIVAGRTIHAVCSKTISKLCCVALPVLAAAAGDIFYASCLKIVASRYLAKAFSQSKQ